MRRGGAAEVADVADQTKDTANRAALEPDAPDAMKVAGLALRDENKTVDKITKGARLHP